MEDNKKPGQAAPVPGEREFESLLWGSRLLVILAVIIEFFRAVVEIRFQTPLDAIYLAVSVLALAASLYLMSHAHRTNDH